MLKNLLPIGSLFTRRLFARIAASAILLLALSIAASAYTIVLRDGRRIEITSGVYVDEVNADLRNRARHQPDRPTDFG